MLGGVGGVLLNQYFFKSNKKFEAAIELKKEQLKIQFPHLNRILTFTYRFDSTAIPVRDSITTVNGKVIDPKDQNSPKFTPPSDSSSTLHGDAVSVDKIISSTTVTQVFIKGKAVVPRIVFDSLLRYRFFEDLNEITKNRSFVDFRVWNKFESLHTFLNRHPLPLFQIAEIEKSEWMKKEVSDEWWNLMKELYQVTLKKMNTIELDN